MTNTKGNIDSHLTMKTKDKLCVSHLNNMLKLSCSKQHKFIKLFFFNYVLLMFVNRFRFLY